MGDSFVPSRRSVSQLMITNTSTHKRAKGGVWRHFLAALCHVRRPSREE